MATYKDLQAQIAQLQKEAKDARANEVGAAVAEIQSLMREFGLMAEDLERQTTKKGRKPQAKGAIKFRRGDQSWSGRGRPPLWLKDEDREKYRVG